MSGVFIFYELDWGCAMGVICQNDKTTIRDMNDCMEDYAIMSNWLSDPAVLEYYEGRDNPFDISKVIEKYGCHTRKEDYVIPCIIEQDKKAIGYIQYYRVGGEEDSVINEYSIREKLCGVGCQNPYGIDLFIGRTDYWNQGIGTVAVKLLVNYLLENNVADIIFIDPQTWNKRAIRCYEKCGFKPIAVLEKRELHEGEYRDNLIMAATLISTRTA
jgi:aminoglycoside 6'-N-acetyltransferase